MLALIAGVALRLAEPWPLKYVFDLLAGEGDRLPIGSSLDPTPLLIACAVAIPVIIALTALAAIGTPHAMSLVKKARTDKDPAISAAAARLVSGG